jgi:hypothetical protein
LPLSLYRRHRAQCEASQHHAEDSLTYEADEKRKRYKGRCRCEIHVGGTLAGKRIRKTTGRTTWDEARAVAEAIEPGNRVMPAPAQPEVEPPPRITIADAIKVYLATREPSVVSGTYRKYRTYTSRLQKFAGAKGYVLLEQFDRATSTGISQRAPLDRAARPRCSTG